MKNFLLKCLLPALALTLRAGAQNYATNNVFVDTFAGSGFPGLLNGTNTQTKFNGPSSIVADTTGNLYVWDGNNHCIRKITPAGVVSTFAGTGGGGLPGDGTNVSLVPFPCDSLIMDRSNNLWSTASGAVVKITTNGHVSLVSTPFLTGLSNAICFDSKQNLYYSDPAGNNIYRWNRNTNGPTGFVEVFAGSGTSGAVDGNGVFTSFNQPSFLTADAADNIYVWDSGNHLIRRINQNRDVVTIAGSTNQTDVDGVGTNAGFATISGMYLDGSGNLLLACDTSIRTMLTGTNVETIAGSFSGSGYVDGGNSNALFSGATGVYASQGAFFVADSGNQRIRRITFVPLVEDTNLVINTYAGVTIPGLIGRSYQVESSTNLSDWNSEATILLNTTPFLWFDPSPLGVKKYYRTLLLP